ncbi:hypothetical protein OBBRIDRAFT_458169 [Obba rivulosa]|uniref:Uncharacterized protein n=1 Tax=Obba rivulosa TaxID=1052685 RepID=A0A8E2DDR4_9APHY|nr:hypothetical protein OBBRIDRAFT_458169 [Obba rivulosa]
MPWSLILSFVSTLIYIFHLRIHRLAGIQAEDRSDLGFSIPRRTSSRFDSHGLGYSRLCSNPTVQEHEVVPSKLASRHSGCQPAWYRAPSKLPVQVMSPQCTHTSSSEESL